MSFVLTTPLAQAASTSSVARLRNTPTHPLYVHHDVVEHLSHESSLQLRKRALFTFRSLMYTGYAPRTKGVVGEARGWLRALLGGNNGSQFYLWYCNWGSEHGRALGLREGAVAVRMWRHHDIVSPLEPGDLDSDYFEYGTADVEAPVQIGESDSGSDRSYTAEQVDLAVNASGRSVTIVMGHPGSGKTTTLWLSALNSHPGKILYLTYSRRLATEASRYFAAFRPEGCEVEVMTFDELVADVAQMPLPMHPDPASSALILHEELSKRPNLLGPLSSHPHELYSELHAHGVGRNLPIPFRGAQPGTSTFMENYPANRREDLPDELIDRLRLVTDHISANLDARAFFGQIIAARTALQNVASPPPERLRGAATILLDEVQDLTQVEMMLFLNVCARIAVDQGQLPRIVIAGDESQTVRPTDFQWGWMRDLVTSVLGSNVTTTSTSLAENLRSPREIARFIEATRSMYALFDKQDRPGGLVYTSTNDTVDGRVMYCRLETDDELAELAEMLSQIPSSCLIYPGFMAPDSIRAIEGVDEILFTPDQVKGLDYDVVCVLDAGARLADLRSLVEAGRERPMSVVHGRTLADQFRVAVSRTSEILLLIDRGGLDHGDDLRNLYARLQTDQADDQLLTFETVDFADLQSELVTEGDLKELIPSIIDSIRGYLADQPMRALNRSATLVRRLEALRRRGECDDALERSVLRFRGVVLLSLLGSSRMTLDNRRDDLATEAKRVLDSGEVPTVIADAVVNLLVNQHAMHEPHSTNVVTRAAEVLGQVRIHLGEVHRDVESIVLGWHNQLARLGLPGSDRDVQRLVECADWIERHLTDDHPYLKVQSESLRRRWGTELRIAGRFATALALLKELEGTDEEVGECHEKLRQFDGAAKAYLRAELIADSARCLCRIANLDDAVAIARGSAQLQLAWFDALLKEKSFARALEAMKRFGVRGARYAACHEGLGRFKDAATEFEKEQLHLDAIRCLRKIPDISKAVKIAKDIDSPDLPILNAMESLERTFTQEIVSSLTDAERNYALKIISHKSPSTSSDDEAF